MEKLNGQLCYINKLYEAKSYWYQINCR